MTHVRRAIRDHVADRLADAARDPDPATGRPGLLLGVAVHRSRLYPAEPPAAAVYTLSEDSAAESVDPGRAPPRWIRRLDLAVELLVAAGADVDDAVDDLAERCERVLARDLTFGGLAVLADLAATDVELVEDAAAPLAAATLVYEVEYRTAADEPGRPLG